MAIINVPVPPMRDLFAGQRGAKNTDVNTGITLPWVRWFRNMVQALNDAITAITGNTIISSTQAGLSGLGLGTANAGQVVWVTDYNHTLFWTGTAFIWGPGDNGSGYISAFVSDPTGNGWQVCDGSTVNRLNQDGSVTSVVVPNYTTAAYVKFASAATVGPIGASGTVASQSAGTPTGTVAVGDNDASVDVQAGAGTTVAADPHQHPATFTGDPMAGHDHAPGSLELRRTQLKAYYRR